MQYLARKAANLVIVGSGWIRDRGLSAAGCVDENPERESGEAGDRGATIAADPVTKTPTFVRFAALDGLRGLAALWIVLFHVDWRNQVTGGWPIRSAYLAVDLFFILSGFVIFWAYGSRIQSRTEFGHFMQLRFFRIYPMHIAVLVGLIGLETIKLIVWNKISTTGQPPFSGTTGLGLLAANVLLLQGSGFFSHLSWNFPSWSISCEFLAYIVFALAAMAGLLKKPAVVCGLAGLGFLTYALISFGESTLNVVYWCAPLRGLSGFAIGALLADLRRRGRVDLLERTPDWQLSALQLLCLLALMFGLTVGSTAWSAVNIPIFALLVCLLQFDRGCVARLLSGVAAQALGLWSYSIYMLHALILLLVQFALKRAGVATVAVGWDRALWDVDPRTGDVLLVAVIVIIIVVSSQTYRYIEEPGRRFGRNLGSRVTMQRAVRP